VLAFGVAVESDVGAGVPAEESAVFRLRSIESAANSGVTATSGFFPGSLGQGGLDAASGNPPPGGAAKPKRRP